MDREERPDHLATDERRDAGRPFGESATEAAGEQRLIARLTDDPAATHGQAGACADYRQ
jgi:hypothetical protein